MVMGFYCNSLFAKKPNYERKSLSIKSPLYAFLSASEVFGILLCFNSMDLQFALVIPSSSFGIFFVM